MNKYALAHGEFSLYILIFISEGYTMVHVRDIYLMTTKSSGIQDSLFSDSKPLQFSHIDISEGKASEIKPLSSV